MSVPFIIGLVAWYLFGCFYVIKSLCWQTGEISVKEILLVIGVAWVLWPAFMILDICVLITMPKWLGEFLSRRFSCK